MRNSDVEPSQLGLPDEVKGLNVPEVLIGQSASPGAGACSLLRRHRGARTKGIRAPRNRISSPGLSRVRTEPHGR